jgi:hypothetical protein
MASFLGTKYLLTAINARHIKAGSIDEIQKFNVEADSMSNYHYASKPQIFPQSIRYIKLHLFSLQLNYITERFEGF